MTVIMGILAVLLTVLAIVLFFAAGILALSVVVSFAVAWYERISGDPALEPPRRHALAIRLMLNEFACLLITLLLRPFGWLPVRIPARPCRRPPVILLHGLFQNRSCLLVLHWRLRAAGFDRIVSVNTPPWRDLDTLVDTVAATIERVRWKTGCDKVFLVGHSMGGILARCYLQLRNGAPQVAACVTLGSPHRGSKLAPFAVSKLGRALLPGSALLTRLGDTPLPAGVNFTAIYSRHDNIIVPADNARLEGADNIELDGMGHTTLLFSRPVAQTIVSVLDKHCAQSLCLGPTTTETP